MAKQQLKLGEVFAIRVPKQARQDVTDYLNTYIADHRRGVGKHVLYLIRRGLEAAGHGATSPQKGTCRS